MGTAHSAISNACYPVRARCNPYLAQERYVLAKFDRVSGHRCIQLSVLCLRKCLACITVQTQVLKVLRMTPEQGRMFYALFAKIDVDFSGDVDIWVRAQTDSSPVALKLHVSFVHVMQEFADFYELTLSLFIQR